MTYGKTNGISYRAVEDFADVDDLQVTMLYLMGFDRERRTDHYAGHDSQLTEVPGRVLTDPVA